MHFVKIPTILSTVPDLSCVVIIRVANLWCVHQKKPDLVPKKLRKRQIEVLRHIHVKHA